MSGAGVETVTAIDLASAETWETMALCAESLMAYIKTFTTLWLARLVLACTLERRYSLCTAMCQGPIPTVSTVAIYILIIPSLTPPSPPPSAISAYPAPSSPSDILCTTHANLSTITIPTATASPTRRFQTLRSSKPQNHQGLTNFISHIPISQSLKASNFQLNRTEQSEQDKVEH